MASAFLWDDLLKQAASLLAPAAVDTAGVSALRDPQPSIRMRCTGNSAGVVVDLGSARAFDAVFWGSTNVGAEAVYRIRASNTDVIAAAGDALDTGLLAANTSAENRGQVVALLSSTITARYLLLELADGTLPYVDVGILAVGLLWRLSRSQSYGFREGRRISDNRTANEMTAAEFVFPAVYNPRVAQFQIDVMSRSDAEGPQRSMLTRLGGVGDALWVPDTGLTRAALNDRCIWGAASRGGAEFYGVERPSFAGYRRSWTWLERG